MSKDQDGAAVTNHASKSKQISKREGETAGGNKADEQKEEEKAVPMSTLFRFATGLDILLMILGTICACAHGTALPCILIVFGDMTDMFIDGAITGGELNSTILQSLGCNWTRFGYEWEDIAPPDGNFDGLSRVLRNCGLVSDVSNLMKNNIVDEMAKFSIYYVIIATVVIFAGYGQVSFWLIASYRQSQKIRITLFRAIMRQEIGWFDTHEAGELNSRLADDVLKIQEGIGDKIGNFFQWFATFFAGFVIGFIYGWKLTLVIIATSPVLVICGSVFGLLATRAAEGELAAYAKAGAVAQEVLSSIRTVFAFGGMEKEAERYKKKLVVAQKYGIKRSVVSGGSMGIVYFVIYAVYALAFWYGAKLVRDEPDNYSGGNILIVFFSVMIGAFALGNAAPNLANLATAKGAAFYVFELIDRTPKIDLANEEGKKPGDFIGNIAINDAKFVYPARKEVQVLDGLNMQVSRGQTAALVGHSGCGKSTVIQLLLRFYDCDSGSVHIDDTNVRDYNLKWLRTHIGLVSQEPVLFATTIKENIMFGREGVTMEEIVQATKEANAYDFIQKLPKKFETLVGERGAQLSGGQKQRIAIARALVRNPKILLLDEATSALDTESEATVQQALDKARQGRTTIVVAHRLSTVKNADVIFGFKDGKIHEKGSHDELMAKGDGIYSQLVKNQQTMDPVMGAVQHEIEANLYQRRDSQDQGTERRTSGKKSSIVAGQGRRMSHALHATEPLAMPEDKEAGCCAGFCDEPEKKDEEDENLPEVGMGRVMRVNSPEYPYMALGCLAAIMNGGVQPAFAVIFAEILGVFAEPPDKQKEQAEFWSGMFMVIAVAAGISITLQAFTFGISGERLTLRIRDRLFRAYLKQEVGYFDDHKNCTGTLCTRLSIDAAAVQGATGAKIGQMFQNLAAIGTGVVIGFVYSWKLTLLLIGFIPLVAIAGVFEMKILQGTANSGRAGIEKAGKIVTEVILNVRTVASLTKEDYFYDEYVKATSIPYKNSLNKAHAVGLTFGISQALIYYADAAIFYLGAYLIENDGLDYVDMFKVFGAVIFGAMAMGEASHFAPDAGKAASASNRIFFLLDRKPVIDSSSADGEKPDKANGVIEFKDIVFHYPTRETVKVLNGFNLKITPGQSVALVGSSGCGKSTSVQLLERFYDPDKGRVLLDGTEIRSLNIQWLRSQMAIVQQEPILFDTSIKENIAYGALDEPSMDDIIKAAREANIHNFISQLPDGYETNVGDKGTQLSGGQKQRIAIARALIRNPKILLLDEATSALDTESEKVVQDALEKAQKGRTSIVIAHRLSTIQNSDCIFVIRNGVVAEQGDHADLLAKQGIYHRLTMAQAGKNKKAEAASVSSDV